MKKIKNTVPVNNDYYLYNPITEKIKPPLSLLLKLLKHTYLKSFLAPSGFKGVTTHNVLLSVRSLVGSSGSSLSRALNLHHSGSGLFQVSLRPLLVLSWASLRPLLELY